MATIRAYKLAEELGIDRNDFVEQAKSHGIELKNAMASLDDDQADLLREKMGGGDAARRTVTERRVEGKKGRTIVRRRKRAKAPEPEPVAAEAVAAEEVAGPSVAETGDVEPGIPEEVVAPADEVVESDAAEAPEPDAPADESAPEPVPAVAARGGDDAEPGARAGVAARGPRAPLADAGGAATESTDRKGRQRKRVREVVNLQEQEQFARQITSRGGPQRRTVSVAPRAIVNPRSKRRDRLSPKAVPKPAGEVQRVVKVEGEISVADLAKELGVKAPVIQGKLMALGVMVSVNQRIDVETCRKLTAELGFEVNDTGFKEETFLEPVAEVGVEAEVGGEPRPPVITVMGHVDHGKTSLLDAIRKTKVKVTAGEAGGITQHIGAYQVEAGGHKLTFIDTPGHAAFTAMRARGAAATDLVVLVVAATEGVMQQTVEAIEHAQAAGCPIVVAINKCDLPDADPQRTRQRLTEHNLVAEDFGGDVVCCDVSAVTGEGLDHLLEMLALQAELLELRADPKRRAKGVVLEARLDKGRGPVATVLIQDGTLNAGDSVVVGSESGRVRGMEDENGKRLKSAGPSTPVQIIGLSGVPDAGATLNAVESDRIAKQIIEHREDREQRGQAGPVRPRMTLEDLYAQGDSEEPKELSIVLKADVQGTCEAARHALEDLSTENVKLTVLSAGVGAIVERDVMLAAASGAIVVGFNVRPDPSARRAADDHGVEIRNYTVIMDMIDEVSAAMAGLLAPIVTEIPLGRAEVLKTFTIPRVGTIAGSQVVEGKVLRGAHCRVVRDGVQVYAGTVGSLRRFKDEAKEVVSGLECGIGVSTFNDIKVGDVLEVYELEEKPATL